MEDKKLSQEEMDEIQAFLDDEECECGYDHGLDIDEEIAKLALLDEVDRIEKFAQPFDVNEHTAKSDVYYNAIVHAETFAKMMRVMVDSGLDYNNSFAQVSAYFQNAHQLEVSKYGMIVQQQNQI